MRCRTLNCPLPIALAASWTLVLVGCNQSPPAGEAPRGEPARPAETAPAEESASQQQPHRESLEVARAERAEAPSLDVPTEPDDKPLTPSQAPPPAPLPASRAPLPWDNVPTADLQMPSVVLSKHHTGLNKVGIGDTFPNFELPNVQGQPMSLANLLGPKLTLVVFWNAKQPTGVEEISDLARYHQPRFADRGLAIVAVNSGDGDQLAGELSQKAGASYPVLSDADGAALGQVAGGKLPRTYLLDPAGKILWFDMEYSPTTRRDLAAAIRKSLGSE